MSDKSLPSGTPGDNARDPSGDDLHAGKPLHERRTYLGMGYSDVAGVCVSFFASIKQWFILAAILGAVVGVVIAGIAAMTEYYLLEEVDKSRSFFVYLFAPLVGLAVAALIIRYLTPDRSNATTEAFLANYHDPGVSLGWRSIPGKVAAAIATVGSGGSAGMEGPSVYVGAAIGSTEQDLQKHTFHADESKVLTVAGAAAGLAAIFRAPFTGVMFSVEGPYMHDLVRFAVAPSLVAASVSYLVYVLLVGSTPIFEVDVKDLQAVPFDQVLFAIVLGVACALAARLFIAINRGATLLFKRMPVWARVVVAGLLVGSLGVASVELVGLPLILGQGIPAVKIFIDPAASGVDYAIAVLTALVLMKMVATAVTLRSVGVGGVFFPLAFIGAGIGAIFTGVTNPADPALYPVIGIAAAIGAAFRAPLTAVVFVAETTGSAAFLIPALIAAAASNALMGEWAISEVQERHELSRTTKARRTRLADFVSTLARPRRVASAMTLAEYASEAHDDPAVVVDDAAIVGVITREGLYNVDFAQRGTSTVADVMDRDAPRLTLDMTVRDAAARLVGAKRSVGVVVANGEPIAVLTERDILRTQDARRVMTVSDIN